MPRFFFSRAMRRPLVVMVPHVPKLFQATETARRQMSVRWPDRSWRLPRNIEGEKSTDPRN
ncbi:MAG: hypothetical protein EBQ51_05055 [Verrucomicrobia bacterium]|nr:hypothetical protein [Verrucomicrobiota bacterium]